MSTTDRETVRRIFMEAMDLPAADRAGYVARESGGREAVRTEVSELLSALAEGDEFMTLGGEAPARTDDRLGTRIGPYEILKPLGEGGFGTVYLAQQEKPLRRQVALKVIKLGMDTRAVIARFETERQALAMMDHPGIARVFDAGATESGRPYFVMEYVPGRPITDYCRQRALDVRARIGLFIGVCQAVQHAHQKGVIHRDIKPSNLLVWEQDGAATVKVIDFGIAKATVGPLADAAQTEIRQLVGTPEYMAPEAAMGGGDVDTRADVFSLGVVLYELLTGTTPIDRSRLRTAGIDELRRMITDEAPKRPSTRVRTGPVEAGGGGDAARAVSLARELRGDLDWIVMRCLEKDRARRYDSAAALAEDLKRFLAQQPVEARPPSTMYVLSKAVRRHRLEFAAGAIVLIALVGGLAASVYGFVRVRDESNQRQAALVREAEQRERAEAGEAAAKAARIAAERTSEFLKSILQGASPTRAAGLDTALLREILNDATSRAETELVGTPDIQADVYALIGEAYRNIAQFDTSEKVLAEAARLRTERFGEKDARTLAAGFDLAMTQRLGANPGSAEATLRQGIEILRSQGAGADQWAPRLRLLAEVLSEMGRVDESIAAGREALAGLEGTENKEVLAQARSALSVALRRKGQLEEAEQLQLKVVEWYREAQRAGGDKGVQLGASLNNLAVMYRQRGRLDDAESLYREALEVRRALYDRPHPDVAVTLLNLGNVLVSKRKVEEGLPLLRESVQMHHDVYQGKHIGEAIAMDRLAIALMRTGAMEEAEGLLRRAVAMIRELRPPGHMDIGTAESNLAALMLNTDRFSEAEQHGRAALEIFENAGSKSPTAMAPLYSIVCDALVRQGRFEDALPYGRKTLEWGRKLGDAAKPELAGRMVPLAQALIGVGQTEEAAKVAREAMEFAKSGTQDSAPDFAMVRMTMGRVLTAEKDFAGAEAVLREARDKVKSPDAEGQRRMKRQAARYLAELFRARDLAEPNRGHGAEAAKWELESRAEDAAGETKAK